MDSAGVNLIKDPNTGTMFANFINEIMNLIKTIVELLTSITTTKNYHFNNAAPACI